MLYVHILHWFHPKSGILKVCCLNAALEYWLSELFELLAYGLRAKSFVHLRIRALGPHSLRTWPERCKQNFSRGFCVWKGHCGTICCWLWCSGDTGSSQRLPCGKWLTKQYWKKSNNCCCISLTSYDQAICFTKGDIQFVFSLSNSIPF